jgi:hypothetical protein
MSRAVVRFVLIGLFWFGTIFHAPDSCCFAGMIIQIEDTEIGAGQSGVVNVWISSSDGTDSLSLYNFVVNLTSIGSPSGTLEFIDPQDTSENLDANYVFVDDLDPSGLLSSTITNSQVEAGDFTNSSGDVPVPALALRRLLARLDVRHVLGPGQSAAQAVGEEFQISLDDSGVTYFDNSNGPADIDLSSFAPGTITISSSSVTAVPEPTSFILFTAGAAGWIVRNRWKRSARADATIAS